MTWIMFLKGLALWMAAYWFGYQDGKDKATADYDWAKMDELIEKVRPRK